MEEDSFVPGRQNGAPGIRSVCHGGSLVQERMVRQHREKDVNRLTRQPNAKARHTDRKAARNLKAMNFDDDE